jgi:hypothetical protein
MALYMLQFSTVQNLAVRENLEKCIKKLSRSHLPGQTAWLEGLWNADALVVTSSSLVSMSSESRKQHLHLVERRSELSKRNKSPTQYRRRLD